MKLGSAPLELFTSVFAGSSDGGLAVTRTQWSALLREAPLLRGKGTLRGRPERLPAGEVWALGSDKAFNRDGKGAREDFGSDGGLEYARRLVAAEVEANPAEVGPPIDILRISDDGLCWVEVKPECAAGVVLCDGE